jgi:hypothetical protein
MTRRGTLAYYLAAWVIGCLFLTLASTIQDHIAPNGISRGGAVAVFLSDYFLILMFGAPLSVVFGFLLRRGMAWFRLEKLWEWVLAGAILVFPMAWGVRWASHLNDVIGPRAEWFELLTFPIIGARELAEHHVLLAVPVAGAMAAALFLIHRAFSQGSES